MARVSPRNLLILSAWSISLLVFWAYTTSQSNMDYPVNKTAPSMDRLVAELQYVNKALSSKNSEVSKLKMQLDQNVKLPAHPPIIRATHSDRNSTNWPLSVPTLFHLMPHLNFSLSALYPSKSLGHARHNVDLVMAVPHVHRQKEDYLIKTLTSLLDGMTEEEKQSTVIVVMVAEPWKPDVFHNVCKEVQQKFSKQLDDGLLEVILPPAQWYPNLDEVPSKWGDDATRVKWRTKQNLDYAFMMLYCSHIGTLYVQLEDDITAKSNYVSSMKGYANSQEKWELLEFSQLGFIGKMFRSSMLSQFVEFLMMFYKHKPVDWLLDNYFWVQECHGKKCPNMEKVRKRYRPSLFQHEGYHSSLDGKIQKLKDKDFKKSGAAAVKTNDPHISAHVNPAARLETSLKAYKQYNLDNVYQGKSVFWCLNPQPGDYITITFNPPVSLKHYKIVSGDSEHKDDRFSNATIEFKPSSAEAKKPPKAYSYDNSGFIVFGFFNTTGRLTKEDLTLYSIAAGMVPAEFGSVEAARIMNHQESQSWAIISEMWFDVGTS